MSLVFPTSQTSIPPLSFILPAVNAAALQVVIGTQLAQDGFALPALPDGVMISGVHSMKQPNGDSRIEITFSGSPS